MWLSDISIRRPVAALVFSLLLLVFGLCIKREIAAIAGEPQG